MTFRAESKEKNPFSALQIRFKVIKIIFKDHLNVRRK